MKSKVLHNFIAIALSLIVILPLAIQTAYTLQEHEHKICTSKEVKHFHVEAIDCGNYHLIIELNSIVFTTDIVVKNTEYFNKNYDYFYPTNYHPFIKLKSSRAPPIFSV